MGQRLHHLHTIAPKKNEISNDHVIMGVGYGLGAFFAHSTTGAILIGTFYFIAAILHISHDRTSHQG